MFEVSLSKKFARPHLNQWLSCGGMHLSLSYTGKHKQDHGPGLPDIKWDPVSKITKAKTAGSMAQLIDHLPNKHKALSSTPMPPKKKRFQVIESFPCPRLQSRPHLLLAYWINSSISFKPQLRYHFFKRTFLPWPGLMLSGLKHHQKELWHFDLWVPIPSSSWAGDFKVSIFRSLGPVPGTGTVNKLLLN
jgi:hypothetical protein